MGSGKDDRIPSIGGGKGGRIPSTDEGKDDRPSFGVVETSIDQIEAPVTFKVRHSIIIIHIACC
jgi:hypothetical protein